MRRGVALLHRLCLQGDAGQEAGELQLGARQPARLRLPALQPRHPRPLRAHDRIRRREFSAAAPVAFSFEAKKRFAQNANGSSWTLGTLYYTKLAGFEEIQNGVVTTVASAALAGGLLTLLPLAHKCLSVKVIIILSVASSSFALFANGIEMLARSIRSILQEAIDAGGSTLRDHRLPSGQEGRYRDAHQVYGRATEPCPRCGTSLTEIRLSARSTTFCPSCQAL